MAYISLFVYVSIHLSFSLSSSDLPFWLLAQPGFPHYLSVSPGPASVFFSLKTLPISGGTPITSFVLQWRETAAIKWNEITVPASGKASPLQSDCIYARFCHNKQLTMHTSSCCVFLCIFVCLFVDRLAITTLKPYTLYTVRLAALNAVGVGQFSNANNVRTQGKRKFFTPYVWDSNCICSVSVHIVSLYEWFTVIALHSSCQCRYSGILACVWLRLYVSC